MKTFLLTLLLLCLYHTSAHTYEKEGSMLLLDAATFDQARKEFEFIMVNFCPDYVQACREFEPIYVEVSKEFSGSDRNIKFAKIDNNAQDDLRKRFDATSYPTLQLFVKGAAVPVSYFGYKEKQDLVGWIKAKTGPAFVKISTVEDMEKLIQDENIFGVFSGKEDSSPYNIFVSTAKKHRDVSFVYTNNGTLKQKYTLENDTLTLFKKFDEGKNVYSGAFTLEDLDNFVNKSKTPVVITYDHHSMKELPQKGLPMLLLIQSGNETQLTIEQTFRKAAPNLVHKLHISIANTDDESSRDLVFRLGLSEEDLPLIIILNNGKMIEKYILEGKITSESLDKFTDAFLNGKLEPYLISEPIPEGTNEDGIKIIVSKNFKEIVMDENNDVLVTFYTPECPDCEEFVPLYNKLAKDLAHVKGLVMGRINTAANELRNVSLRKFPTIRLYPRGQKHAHIDYLGEFKQEDLTVFLEKHSKADLSSGSKLKSRLLDL